MNPKFINLPSVSILHVDEIYQMNTYHKNMSSCELLATQLLVIGAQHVTSLAENEVYLDWSGISSTDLMSYLQGYTFPLNLILAAYAMDRTKANNRITVKDQHKIRLETGLKKILEDSSVDTPGSDTNLQHLLKRAYEIYRLRPNNHPSELATPIFSLCRAMYIDSDLFLRQGIEAAEKTYEKLLGMLTTDYLR